MQEQKNYIYEFESFRIDILKRQLSKQGKVLPLTSKAFATLLILIQNQGKTVKKEELMNSVWFETAVEENNLTQQISTLRKTLGEQIRTPKFIVTIPGQGYCFIADVKENFDSETIISNREVTNLEVKIEDRQNETFEADVNKTKNINKSNYPKYVQTYGLAFLILVLEAAVISTILFYNSFIFKPAICILPFQSLNNNEKSNLYSAGIPSYVTAKIGNLPNMIVRPVDLDGKYFGQEQNIIAVGRDNNVDAVLTGSTFCEGETVQIIVHLWDVKNNRQIWAKVFTQNAADSFNVQESISEEIISVLRTELFN